MKRYVVLAAATVFQLCLGGVYAWSYFLSHLERAFGIPEERSQNIFGVCIFVFTLCMILGGRLQHRWGPRRVALLGALLYAGGYLGAGFFASRFWHFLLFKGIIEGAGIGFGYVCPLITALKWFPNRKGLVTGLVVGGFGGGAVVLSSAAHALLADGRELSQAFVILGFGYLVIAGGAAALLSWPKEEMRTQKGDSTAKQSEMALSVMFKDSRFRSLVMAMFAGTFGGLMIIGSLAAIGREGGVAEGYAVLAISIFAVGNSLGRLIWGMLIDRFGKMTIPLSLLFLALALLVLLFTRTSSPVLFVAAAGLTGFGFGACFVLYAAQTAVFFGADLVGVVYPIVFVVGYGIPGIVGPGVGGFLRYMAGNYSLPIVFAALLAAVGGMFSVFNFSRAAKQGG